MLHRLMVNKSLLTGFSKIKSMKVALIVIYNHKYDKNIEIVEKIYKNRFSTVYHLVPFYTGDKPNVIPVYDNSHYFEGYIAQGYKSFFNESFTHYFFVADDMIINPSINENNYADYFHLDKEKSFIPDFYSLYRGDRFWPHALNAFSFRTDKKGTEVRKELPDPEEAEQRYVNNGAINRPFHQEKPLKWKNLYDEVHWNLFRKQTRTRFFQWLPDAIHKKRYFLNYPLVGSYSDISIISAQNIRQFCHYCGVFATLELFAEAAIPSALALSANKIVTEKYLSFKGMPLWTDEDLEFLSPYKKDLGLLMKNYPKDVIYIHPVKLSQWDCKEIFKI